MICQIREEKGCKRQTHLLESQQAASRVVDSFQQVSNSRTTKQGELMVDSAGTMLARDGVTAERKPSRIKAELKSPNHKCVRIERWSGMVVDGRPSPLRPRFSGPTSEHSWNQSPPPLLGPRERVVRVLGASGHSVSWEPSLRC